MPCTNISKPKTSLVVALSLAACSYQCESFFLVRLICGHADRNLERKLNPRAHAARDPLARRSQARRTVHAGNKMHGRQVSHADFSGTRLPVPTVWAADVQRRRNPHT